MNKEEIDKCNNIEMLQNEQENVYEDCVRINNCSICFHANERDVCDLDLLTRRIYKLEKQQ